MEKHRIKIVYWLNIASIVLNPLFIVWCFGQGHYLLCLMCSGVLAIAAYQNLMISRGRYTANITMFVLAPLISASLIIGILSRGDSGYYWTYPIILTFFFLLPRTPAFFASVCLGAITAPLAVLQMDWDMAYRFSETLVIVIVISTIFVSIIEHQQNNLEEKEQLLRETVADVSHELRTPLATTLAKVEAMKDGIRQVTEVELASLSNSVSYLSGLVNDLHILSLSDVSELVCLREDVPISEAVTEAVARMSDEFEKKALKLVLNIDKNLRVEADPLRVNQMLENLLSNCARYTKHNGTVYISTSQCTSKATIIVEDSGPGVTSIELNQLFNRYYRIDKSRSRELGGSGMGLPLVRALAIAQEGDTWAAHSAKGGLRISFSLPKVVA